MRKGQLEIFGLAIIFMFFLFGLLIFVKFSSKQAEPIARNFMMDQIPSRVLQTMTETTTSCKKQPVESLISDIAGQLDVTADASGFCQQLQSDNQIECTPTTRSYEELFNVNSVIDQIFINSLDQEKINYEFEVKMLGKCTIYAKNSTTNCRLAEKVSAETFMLTSKNGKVELTLKVC